MPRTYRITEIKPKNGVLRETHKDMLGGKTYIIEANPGERGLIKVIPSYDDEYHTFCTTPIVKCDPWYEDPDTIVVETERTFYVLTAVS